MKVILSEMCNFIVELSTRYWMLAQMRKATLAVAWDGTYCLAVEVWLGADTRFWSGVLARASVGMY